MKETIIKKEDFLPSLRKLNDTCQVLVPVRENDYHAFRLLDGDVEPDFSFLNTRISAKGLIQPQSEKMFRYSLSNDDPEQNVLKEVERDYPPRAIVGIRPCDALAVELVRINFETSEFKDPFWLKRWEAITFVGLACNNPCSTCFCTSVGGGPYDEKGLDVLLVDVGNGYTAKPLTDKGQKFVETAEFATPAGDEDLKKISGQKEAAEKKIESFVPTEKLKENSLTDLFDADFWEDVAFSCINCGTCTYLCPTCWCFDIQDEVHDKQGIRMRNWDSCMFPLFTLHGSGHNPRSDKVQRVRQRFMHKLKYYVDKYDQGVACVGCGRCVQFCPVNIDIRKVFKLVNDFGQMK